MSLYFIPPIIVSLLLLSLGIFVFYKNSKNIFNRIFLLLAVSSSVWLFFYALAFSSKSENRAELWLRIGYCGIILISVTFFHYTVEFLNLKKLRREVVGSYLFALLWVWFLWTTDYLIRGVQRYFWGFYPLAGKLHPLFLVFFVGLVSFALTLLLFFFFFKKKELTPLKRIQIRYLFLAFFIFNFASIDFLPNYGITIYPFGFIPAMLFSFTIAYVILRYRLMDIRVVITRTGIFIAVYAAVLGIPFAFASWLKEALITSLGANWWMLPLGVMACLATIGPFAYIFLVRKAEDVILREQKRCQAAIIDLTQLIAEIRNLDELAGKVTSTLAGEAKTPFCVMYVRDDGHKSFRLKGCRPIEAKERFPEFIPGDDPLPGALAGRRVPLLSEESGRQGKIIIESGLFVPCFGRNGLLGIIVLGTRPSGWMYTDDDMLAFKTLSGAVSLGIENCNFWKELENRQRMARIDEMHTFSYSLAHEIDNPMTILIRGIEILRRDYAGYVSDEAENKKLLEWLEYMNEAAWRVSGMVKAVQEFGQRTSSDFKPVKLEKSLDTFLKLYIPHFKMNAVNFTREIPESLPMVRGISQEIEQSLMILSKNAIQALKDTKEKKVHLKVELINTDWVRMSLIDNGPGIEKEKLLTIFTAFYTTKGTAEGTGMGLYNATQFIVERHKGKLWAESEGAGKGARFIIELPVAKDIRPDELKTEKKSNIIKF